MPTPNITKESAWQGADTVFLDRVVREGTTPLVIDDVSTWSLRVFERDDDRDGKWIVRDASPVSYLNDTLSTASGWSRDTTGWNFKYRLLWTLFKPQARTYRYEFSFTTSSYGTIFSVWQIKYLPTGTV